jgi:predicted porin
MANVRYQDRDDKTPVRVYLTDGEPNQPYSSTTAKGKVEATYALPQGFNLTGGVDYDWRKRTIPDAANLTPSTTDRVVVFRGRNNETTYRLQLRRSLSETLNGSLAYLHGTRGGSSFLVDSQNVSCFSGRSAPGLCTAAGPVSTYGTINPVHFADRDRNNVRVMLDWMPFTALSLQFNLQDSRDDYAHTASRPYGLRNGSARLYSVDATYSVSQDWQLTAWYSYDRTRATQFNQQSNGYLWVAHLSDTANPLGLQLRGNVGPKLKIGADAQWTSDIGEYPVETASLGALLPPPSQIQNKITSLKLFGQYAVRERGEVRVEYRYDRFRTDDWTWMMWDASGTALTPWRYSDGTFVAFEPRQSASFIGVRYLYRFK